MKASVYNERNKKTQEFESVEKALKFMSDEMEIAENDPVNYPALKYRAWVSPRAVLLQCSLGKEATHGKGWLISLSKTRDTAR